VSPRSSGEDLVGHYETLRHIALSEGVSRGGLGAALLMAKGMAAWVRGWRACAPPIPRPAAPVKSAPSPDVVSVLAAMALACT
jgi:hypothetical protein